MSVGPAKARSRRVPEGTIFVPTASTFVPGARRFVPSPAGFVPSQPPVEHRIGGCNGLSRRYQGGNSARDVNDLRPSAGRSGMRRRPIRRAAARPGKSAVPAPWAVNHCCLREETHLIIGTAAADSHLPSPISHLPSPVTRLSGQRPWARHTWPGATRKPGPPPDRFDRREHGASSTPPWCGRRAAREGGGDTFLRPAFILHKTY
jgi:hypothetical protein